MPLLAYVEQNNVYPAYTFGADWSDPVNVNALTIQFKLFRCPSSPSAGTLVTPYATNFITPGNNAFAPPAAAGASVNVLGGALYPTAKTTSTGWTADYAPATQVKTMKNGLGAEVGYANPLVAAAYPPGTVPSKGAMRQNGPTRMTEITDGTSHTILYGEAAGRDRQCYAGHRCVGYDAAKITGPIWADADNRITVTGTSWDGLSQFGTGPCAMNCNNLQGDIYSFHTGGSNVSFADGSVRFLSASIDIKVLAALVTKEGGEVTDE